MKLSVTKFAIVLGDVFVGWGSFLWVPEKSLYVSFSTMATGWH